MKQAVLSAAADDVQVRVEKIVMPTFLPAPPDKNPMFLEKRVYQGSSGRVYPLPFTDRVAEKPVDRAWQAVWIENEFLRVMVLPELGGRIHRMQDKTNGYDLTYHQTVMKPALVGLAGPWISGGIEFNWPQHHRPATFLPVDFEVEEHANGSKTIWCSDHDPMCRMKGMHGVCLHPDKAYLELKVRAHLAVGRIALQNGESGRAISHFRDALQAPLNLGEAKHLLANQSDVHYWLGVALEAAGDVATAREHWTIAANFKGDFQEMRVRAFSEMTYYSALALVKLGKKSQAQKLFRNLHAFARKMQKSVARIEYFATSLPTMLLFDDDLRFRQATTALFLQAQAMLGLGKKSQANSLLKTVLRRDPNHAAAADLLAGEAL